jgi:hypothetical protein
MRAETRTADTLASGLEIPETYFASLYKETKFIDATNRRSLTSGNWPCTSVEDNIPEWAH